MLFLLSALVLITRTEGLRVIGGSVTAGHGDTVVFPCQLTDTTETLTQISWQRTIKGKPPNQNFTIISTNGDDPKFVNGYDGRFQFIGSIKQRRGNLQLSNITLKDEGTYSCIFTLFPSGNHKTEIPLQVLVPPLSSLEDNRPGLGDEEVSLVTCTAAGAKPPAGVKWLLGDLDGKVRSTTNSTIHDNGTTTTVSSLFGKPTKEINHQSVSCVVSSAALSTEENLPYTIQVSEWNLTVYNKPEEVGSSWSFLIIITSVVGLLLCVITPAVCLCRKSQTKTPNQDSVSGSRSSYVQCQALLGGEVSGPSSHHSN